MFSYKRFVACSMLIWSSAYAELPPLEVLQSDDTKSYQVALTSGQMTKLKKYLIGAIKDDLHLTLPLTENDLYIRVTEGGSETRRILFIYAKKSSDSLEEEADANISECDYQTQVCEKSPSENFRLIAVMKVNSEAGSEEPEKLKMVKGLALPEEYFLTATNTDHAILALPQLIKTRDDIPGGDACVSGSTAEKRTCPYSLAIAASGFTLKDFM